MQMVQIAHALDFRLAACQLPNQSVDNLHHDDCQPETGTEALHHHVGWDLSRDIEGKEDSQGIVVLKGRSWDVQIREKIEELCISDVGTI